VSSAPLGHVWLVGAGPGHPGLITALGLDALRRAEVVLYDRLSPRPLIDEAPAGAALIDVGKAAGDHTMTQEEINAALVEHGRAGRRVVRLKGGDPYVFGRGGEEALALAAAGVPCTVVQGVTSAIGGLGLGGIPVTQRGVAASFAVVTGHEDPTKPAELVHWERLAAATDTLVVLMGVERLDEIAAALIAGGRDKETPAAVVQNASLPTQRTVTAPLASIAAAARAAGVRAPALFVVGDVAALQPSLDPARLAPLAGKRVLVTRTRAQASVLADLLRLEGAHPVLLPALELEQRAEPEIVARALDRLARREYAWVVFTSANGVEVFLDLAWQQGADARVFAGTAIAAIGSGTERALARHGLRADLVPADAIGEAVVEAMSGQRGGSALAGVTVLLPRAEGGRDVLPDGLRAAGATVDQLTLYLAAPPAAAPPEILAEVRSGAIDVVTFTSSSTVRNLATLLGGDLSPLLSATIACIGPIVANTAEEHGLHPQVIAEEHTIPGLVAALRAYLHSQREAG
jgi:uroporphyrinogen III methyltransferase / synthase